MSDELDYLQDGFDPASLTVPRIRSVLVTHNIGYPSGAKKAQLVEIFNEDLRPQARKILNERARAKRTSRGIVDAESSQESSAQESIIESPRESDVILPPPRTRVVRQSPAKVRASVDISDDEPAYRNTRRSTRSISPVKRMPRASSPVKRTPKPSVKHPRQEEETLSDDDDVPQTVRKSRKSTTVQTPMVGARDNLDGVVQKKDSRRESNFTHDNPFQRGSPPRIPISSHDSKRKSMGGSAMKELEKRRSSISRRRTVTPQANVGIRPPTSSTFEIPVSSLDGLKDYDENGVEISEDFTPEAQFELEREQQRGRTTIQPRRKASNGVSMSGPIWMILLTLLGGYATWYRQEKIAVGFCGVGREAHSIIPVRPDLPDWVQVLAEPQCDWCPQHAYCNANYEVQCDQDFILKHHPLSLGGFLPLPPTCEPDGEKQRRVKAVADRAVEELRERRAKWECGDLTDEAGAPEPTVEIDAEHLKKEVSQKRRKGMGEAEFEELWLGAIGEIKGRDEVVVGADGSNTLTSTSLARLPLVCAVKRSFRHTLARYYLEIGSLILAFILFLYARSSIRNHTATKAAIPALVSLTLQRLATQASLHASDPDGFKDGWISIGQLRDDVLRDEHSLKKREQIWTKVKKVVEMNSNVRSMQRESQNGEISRVWEWIGALEDVDGSVRRRKSGRGGWSTPGRERDDREELENTITPRWDEPGSKGVYA
ncbi:putative sister chromatid separation protein [Botrytis fragariae]|uniref:Putative sister chromatid separation protein n=1 Tax=Botrytis fragariae TaxID=1964551 RepID=A0A8H6AP14_9HELO|nr:putative sister chromatid separation protein [Botrytis fragariae]KAF5870891.1 putative sister chromatid separation protein [Botrytis fragariae]